MGPTKISDIARLGFLEGAWKAGHIHTVSQDRFLGGGGGGFGFF